MRLTCLDNMREQWRSLFCRGSLRKVRDLPHIKRQSRKAIHGERSDSTWSATGKTLLWVDKSRTVSAATWSCE